MIKYFLAAILMFCTSVYAADYYISPTGSDANNGVSTASPVATFSHAYTLMSPGDILYLMDGVYQQQLYPVPQLSGSAAVGHTVFAAINPGEVILRPTAADIDPGNEGQGAIQVYSNTSRGQMEYLKFYGIIAEGVGERNAIDIRSADGSAIEDMSNHIIFSLCGAYGSAIDTNHVVWDVAMVTDVLIEDSFAFGFGRKALQLFGSDGATVRRFVARYDWWEGDDYKASDPRTTTTCYNTINSTYENIIAFDSGPHPSGIPTPDRGGFTLSGNDTGSTGIQGSSNSGYWGSIVLNNPGNGLEVNGGSGDPVTNLIIKDLVFSNVTGVGFNIQNNLDGIDASYLTSINNNVGFRIDDSGTVQNINVNYTTAQDNTSYGYSNTYNTIPTTFTNSSGVRNGNDQLPDIEPEYAPTILYIPTNTPVAGHERGADVTKRYVDRVKTATNLWPWPNEELIKTKMCDPAYLQEIEDAINAKEGTSITYTPGWCATGKTLTDYVWSYLGSPCPSDICGDPTCDASHLSLCNDQSSCQGAGGNWCAGGCQSDPCATAFNCGAVPIMQVH